MAFSCGNAYALPQDWPCKVFELERNGEVRNEDMNTYSGQDGTYALKVNIFLHKNTKSDDCGSAGCNGTIKNIKTGETENLRFFCETENNYNNAKCHIRTGEEYILQKISDEYYQITLCDDTFYKYVHINECSECTCILHDSRKQNGDSDFYMGCKKDKDYLHCMTGNIYEEKYYPASEIDDFKNCVNLTLFP
jgi:hypothetical protein